MWFENDSTYVSEIFMRLTDAISFIELKKWDYQLVANSRCLS